MELNFLWKRMRLLIQARDAGKVKPNRRIDTDRIAAGHADRYTP
jgi:hypothetical protein